MKRILLGFLAAWCASVFLYADGAASPNDAAIPLTCTGVFEQGGLAICQTSAGANVEVSRLGADKKMQFLQTKSDKNGKVFIGFDRDDYVVTIASWTSSVGRGRATILPMTLKTRDYAVSRIDGLPPSQVSTFNKEQLAHIKASSARKRKGFASREQTLWFKDGFIYPLKTFIKTSPFGAQRILNGETKRPHYGVDIAAPIGTPIYAPADGTVSLADDDLYFEGAMVLLDHGQGLISMYLHMNEIDVTPGQQIKQGDRLGAVGAKGRATGPHLCWRLKWRNRNLDPELLTEWPVDD